MAKSARDRLAQLLSDAGPTGADSAMLRVPGDVLSLEVAGLGLVKTPIRAAQAKQLITAAQPAAYGHGEQTLSDASVRDTWEIAPEKVILGGPSWQSHLDAALEHFCQELGLPDGARLTAELHSLLVYGKGQFFLPHQDSEKHDDMVATLVVMLPSAHTGGELIVDDAGSEQSYGGTGNDLVLVAFYADRRHEVKPVLSGYRVSLTFNLLLAAPESSSGMGGRSAEAASCLTEHFTTHATSQYGGRDLGVPRRLVFLLDHEYTQSGLGAGLFKGADATRVAVLQAAAEEAGCQMVFALAEIRETWDALPQDTSWRGGWYDDDEYGDEEYGDDDDGVEDDGVASGPDDDAYELNTLIDDEIALGWWTGSDGSGAETIKLPLDASEVCMVTPTESTPPYETEFEGYMGNYGNTLDRWYRRAAVVMWPRSNDFAARAEAGSVWALRYLLGRIESGELEGARVDAALLEPFWTGIGPELLTPALQLAAGLADPVIGRVVAAPFRIQMLTADHAPLLAALASEYGDPWVLELMGHWLSLYRSADRELLTWINETLNPLCQELRPLEADRIADGCVALLWNVLGTDVTRVLGHKHPEKRQGYLADLASPMARVLEAGSVELGTSIADSLRHEGGHVVELLMAVLRAHRPQANLALLSIAHDCQKLLTRRLELPARDLADWSIRWTGCGCALCHRFEEFLSSGSERTLAWPLATPGRQHIHHHIDDSGLPVLHTTQKQGRPYTLLLTKTDELFGRDGAARRQAGVDLQWLKTTFG